MKYGSFVTSMVTAACRSADPRPALRQPPDNAIRWQTHVSLRTACRSLSEQDLGFPVVPTEFRAQECRQGPVRMVTKE